VEVDGIGGGRGGPKRKWHCIGIGAVILAHLTLFLIVTEDDNVAVTRQTKKTVVEVAE
jgi:hypothetical protein